MSLIRATSNPEGLYIWGDGKTYSISTGINWELSNIGPDQPIMNIPNETFEEAARQWEEKGSWGRHTIEYKGFRIETNINIFVDTLEEVPDDYLLLRLEKQEDFRETFWGLKISYKDLYTYLYIVTWTYATNNLH